jgi:hypothetical protein
MDMDNDNALIRVDEGRTGFEVSCSPRTAVPMTRPSDINIASGHR